jgi:hypothetical protein
MPAVRLTAWPTVAITMGYNNAIDGHYERLTRPCVEAHRNQQVQGRSHNFAAGCSEQEKLSEVLHRVDEDSLSQLIRDHEAGRLDEICKK